MLACLYVFAKWVNKNYYKTPNFLFKDIDRNAVKSYLDSLQKPLAEDENSKWIGTRNADIIILQTFYRWLFHSNIPQEERPLPDCVSGIKKMKRKGNDSFARYTPSDLWQPKEHLVF